MPEWPTVRIGVYGDQVISAGFGLSLSHSGLRVSLSVLYLFSKFQNYHFRNRHTKQLVEVSYWFPSPWGMVRKVK